MKIAVIGNGAIGGPQVNYLLKSTDNELLIVDADTNKANSSLENAARFADLFIISLPSAGGAFGNLDTHVIESAIAMISNLQRPDKKRGVVIRSTVPVGFTRKMQELFPAIDFYFVPEFLTQSTADQDFMVNARLIVGVQEKSEARENAIKEMSKIFPAAGDIFACEFEIAELTKLATNSFYATKVIFFNELNAYCERRRIDYKDVKFLISRDPRIGSTENDNQGRDVHMRIAQDGQPGFGGKCLTKDAAQLAKLYRDAQIPGGLLNCVIEINQKIRSLPGQKNIKNLENKNTKTKTTTPAPKKGAHA